MAVGGEFGHETVSRVVKIGRNVTGFTVGERVYPYPLYAKDDPKRTGTIGCFVEHAGNVVVKMKHSTSTEAGRDGFGQRCVPIIC